MILKFTNYLSEASLYEVYLLEAEKKAKLSSDDKGKLHFFLKADLVDMVKEEEVVKRAYAVKSDLEEWSEFLPIERMSHTPKILDEFHEILEIEKIKAQTELEYAIKSDKPKEVKLKHKFKRDNIKTIIDFVNQ